MVKESKVSKGSKGRLFKGRELVMYLKLKKRLASGIKGKEYKKCLEEYSRMKVLVTKYFEEHPELSKFKG